MRYENGGAIRANNPILGNTRIPPGYSATTGGGWAVRAELSSPYLKHPEGQAFSAQKVRRKRVSPLFIRSDPDDGGETSGDETTGDSDGVSGVRRMEKACKEERCARRSADMLWLKADGG
ncbi:hypothetical protein F383_09965 [Gossypium arboreum]|uniref:Uncharacterized protein n=1 Tax=Gossypium arboreum TaxID=29729 RepID=A0A0B0PLH3_GOSAR|nr:hypothetical protein F383_09965 [Gossypium arboreum]